MKLKKLDKYIIGKFMGSFFVALALQRPSRPSSWTIT